MDIMMMARNVVVRLAAQKIRQYLLVGGFNWRDLCPILIGKENIEEGKERRGGKLVRTPLLHLVVFIMILLYILIESR
jgi:hypothetical protein